MKNIYILILLVLVSVSGVCQIRTRSVLVGGSLFYLNDKYHVSLEDRKTESGTINLSAGKAFKENKIVGLTFSYAPLRQSFNSNYGDTTNLAYDRFDIGVFYRQYKKLAKDLYFFSQAEASFMIGNRSENYKNPFDKVRTKERGASFSFTPGLSYQVFKKVQLEVMVPNIFRIQYLSDHVHSENYQARDAHEQRFLFYSNLSNNTVLGMLGVGFRFII